MSKLKRALRSAPLLHRLAKKLHRRVKFFGHSRYAGIPGRLHPYDTMLVDASRQEFDHYARVGADALDLIGRGLAATGRSRHDVEACLDFGSGYGRVTRVLAATIPPSRISAFDIDQAGPAFCVKEFGVRCVRYAGDWKSASFETYDLIWVGSVFTHLTEADTHALLAFLGGLLRPRGLLILTTHGDEALRRNAAGFYGEPTRVLHARITQDVSTRGFSFVPFEGTPSYGTTWLSKPYIDALVGRIEPCVLRVVAFWPAGWDRHQDVFVLARDA